MNSVTSNAVAAAINALGLKVNSAVSLVNDNDLSLQVLTYGKIALFSAWVKRAVNTKQYDITSYECYTPNTSGGLYNNIKAALTWSAQTVGEMGIVIGNGKKIEVTSTGQCSGSLVAFLK